MDKIQPFKYWVQKTLPAVYDDSLSYYQLLAKIVHHLNTIGDTQNEVIDKVKEFMSWFDNLDVQDEINVKLDKMVEDGTLDRIINHNIFNELNAQLAQTEQHLEYKAIDVKNKYGTTSDAIKQAIEESKTKGNTIELFPAVYTIDKTVVFDNVKVISHIGVIFKVIANVNGVQIGTNCDLDGKLIIDTTGVSPYTKAACYVTGGQGGQMGVDHITVVEKIVLKGTPGEGIGFLMYSDSRDNFIDYMSVQYLFIRGYKEQFKLDCHGDGWINGNNFDKITLYQGEYNFVFNNEGDGTGSNVFSHVQIQKTDNSKRVIVGKGMYNNIFSSLIVFDWNWREHAIILDDDCRYNYIVTNLLPVMIRDNGFNSIHTTLRPLAARTRNLPGNASAIAYSPDDNFLAYADKKFDVKQTSGNPPTSGSLSSLFNQHPRSVARWYNPTPVTIEISPKGYTFRNIHLIGINFIDNHVASNIKIETYDGEWRAWLDKKGNTLNQVFVEIEEITSNISVIRITLSGGERFDVESIFGFSSHGGLGGKYIQANGGEVFGDLEFKHGTGIVLQKENGSYWRLEVADDNSVVAKFVR